MAPKSPSHARIANASLASVLAAGCFYLIAASQPVVTDTRRGPTRATAIASGGEGQREPLQRDTVERLAPSAASKAPMKVVGAVTDRGKPCDEQTWPYIETRCLAVAEEKPTMARTDGAAPRGLRDMLAGAPRGKDENSGTIARREIADSQPVGSVTALAPTPPVQEMQANNVGKATSDPSHDLTDGMASEGADIPLPQPRPEIAAASEPSLRGGDDSESAPRAMSRAEYRRWEREQRRAQKELEREQRRLVRAERRARDAGRIVRRWTEYSYDDDSRVVVIHQGSRTDRFFLDYR